MTGYYDDQILRDIEARVDIVDLVSETVKLNRKGNRYWGLCPFHQEKTPSFSVSRDKQMFYCFGCHAGGNLFSYVMKIDGVDFREAVEILAAKAGVELLQSGDKNKIDYRKQVAAVNLAAAEYYQQMFFSPQGSKARIYLEKRGVSQESIETFKLGYAPDRWNDLEEYLLKKGFSHEIVKLAGLIKRSEQQNRYYDLFRDRIIFPIFMYNRDIVGFGGRIMGDGQPKYLNTTETDLFSKRRNLYGLSQARTSLREKNEAILVEGYMDCIKLHQSGVNYAVASLGTAFTEEQAGLLGRYVEKVLVLYDGDEAGQRETLRASSILTHNDLKVDIVTLPGGRDPDEYIERNGKKEFLTYIQNNRYSDIEFKINRQIMSVPEMNVNAKVDIIRSVKSDINRVESAVQRGYYILMLAQKLRLEESLVQQEFAEGRNLSTQSLNRNKNEIIRDNKRYGKYGIQEKILAAMLRNDATFTRIQNSIGINFFGNPDYKALANIYAQLQGGKEEKMQILNRRAAEESLDSAYAAISLLMEEDRPNEEREVNEFIYVVKKKREEAQWQKAFDQLNVIDQDGDFYSALSFLIKFNKLITLTREGGIQ
ncbi:MAG: DNA primase [Bacillota bacterium]|nr:DNA primase [Bacillota bacterium]